jgi:hypothetical protein
MEAEEAENTRQKNETDGKCHMTSEALGVDSEDTSDNEVG